MSTLTIEQVIKTVQQVPSLSTLVVEVLASFDKKDVNFSELVQKISRDQGLTTRVLRVANSPFYGNSGKIGSVKAAVIVLGFHNVRSLVVAAGLINQFPAPATPSGFDRLGFWRHSIGSAVCANRLAMTLGRDQSMAFTAGLLHDIGKLVLDAYFSENLAEMLEYYATNNDISMIKAERAVLGIDHTQIGYELTRRWHFPVSIQKAIRDHHDSEREPSALTDLAHIANVLSHMLDFDNSDSNDGVPLLSSTAWTRLGMDHETLPMQLAEIERQYASMQMLV